MARDQGVIAYVFARAGVGSLGIFRLVDELPDCPTVAGKTAVDVGMAARAHQANRKASRIRTRPPA